MWKCPKCAEESEDTFDSCWNCQTERPGSPRVTATAASDDDPFEPAAPDLPPSNLERRAALPPFGPILAAALGGLCIILGVVQLNSAGSQLTRAFGGRDDTATTLIVIGFVLLLGGLLAFALRRGASPKDSAQSDAPEQRLSRIEELRRKGLISKPEYQRLRSEILKQL